MELNGLQTKVSETPKRVMIMGQGLYDRFRLELAVTWANFKYRVAVADKKKDCRYFVLPNQDERLVVLNYEEIERLKAFGKIEYKNVGRMKVYTRKKNISGSIRTKKVRRVRVIGKRAVMASLMDYKVTINDVVRESFYYTPTNKEGVGSLSEKHRTTKQQAWVLYMRRVRQDAKDKKPTEKRKETLTWLQRMRLLQQ